MKIKHLYKFVFNIFFCFYLSQTSFDRPEIVQVKDFI